MDVVFPGHAVEACPGLDVVADRAVYVVHVPNFADTGAHRARVRALGRELRRRNYRAMLVHLSDEGGDVDDFYEPWPLVLRQYFDAALAEKWGGKLLFLPLGYASGHGRKDAPSARRPVTWAFVGDAKGKPTRRKMLAALGAWPRGVSHVTSRSTTGRPWRPDVWSAATLAALYASARYCPAPMGFESPESFRYYEALEAGCAPVVEGGSYFSDLLARVEASVGGVEKSLRATLLVADDWAAVPDALDAAADDEDRRRSDTAAAWAELKTKLAATVAARERALDDGNRRFAVFVAVPKTGGRRRSLTNFERF